MAVAVDERAALELRQSRVLLQQELADLVAYLLTAT